MASTKLITDLYKETIEEITKDSSNWKQFLKTASMNYKRNFQDLVLIYAQRPEAVACLSITCWNKNYNRWVKKYSKGIAILSETNGRPTIEYLFDSNDTQNRYGKQLHFWNLGKHYENDVIESLSNSYNIKEDNNDIVSTILSASKILVKENLQDYLKNFTIKNEEFLMDILSASVSYMTLNRCGILADNYILDKEFDNIKDFSTLFDRTNLGLITTDISKMELNEIQKTIRNLRIQEMKEIYTFAESKNVDYDNVEERRDTNESRIQDDRGLYDTEFNFREKGTDEFRQVQFNETQLSQKREERPIHDIINTGQTRGTLDGYSENSRDENRTDSKSDSPNGESGREYESTRSNEMGRTNEQHQETGRRDDSFRPNLQLESYEKTDDISYVVTDDIINQILSGTPHLKKSNKEIKDFFSSEKDNQKRIEFLQNIFNDDYTGFIVDDEMYWYKTYNNGILFRKGKTFINVTAETFLSWEDIPYHYEAMILLNQLNDRVYRVPSVSEQMSTIENQEQTPDLEFTQEFIDRYLTETHRDTKYSIYEFFSKSLSLEDNINFLKNLYGLGGSSYTIKGAGVGVDYDSKGLTFNRGLLRKGAKEQLFKWNYIEKRLTELIKLNRYLNPKELEEYPKWLEEKDKEDKLNDLDFLNEEEAPEEEYVYQYKVGDKVYIGENEYQIDRIGDLNVVLYDYEYPLFNREMSKDEFDRKVQENPSNDHLKVKKSEIKEQETQEIKEQEISEISKEEEIPKEESKLVVPYLEKKKSNRITTFDIHPEIPKSERSQFSIGNYNLGVGSPREKFARNIEAIKVLKKCEEENRFATPEEQEILSSYVGWGGLSQVFEEFNSSWSNEYNELKKILDEEEYSQSRANTLTAFYTPPVVIKAMYKALENMGLKEGNILEPSCGIGNFLGMLPETLDDCNIYGIELDSITGRIARQLYQKSSIAVKGFEDVNLPDSFFDVAIGNVPFGNFKVYDKRYDKNNFLIHDYFFAKTLDKVRPGGVIAFITSKGTMDKESPNVRKYIAQRADLIGAIRLPNDTFKDNAGTEITADIIFLKKRESIKDIEPSWVYLNEDSNGIKINQYFIDNPDMIIGNMELVPGRFGQEAVCINHDGNLEEKLEKAITNLKSEITEYELEDIDEENLSIPADLTVKNFSYTVVDGKIYFREDSRMYPLDVALTTENRIKGLIKIRDCVRNLLNMQVEDYSDEEIKKEQSVLNRLYDSYTKEYGLINERGNSIAFRDDSSYYLLCSLEILDENGKLKRKADIFSKRTVYPKKEISSVDNARDALIASLNEKGRIDFDYMYKLSGITVDKLIKDLEGEIFNIPENDEFNNWVTADEYLSGNVRQKLRIAEKFAKEDERFNINVKYLKESLPKKLSASEIDLRLGSTWIPPYYIKKFIDYLLTPDYRESQYINVTYLEYNALWNISHKGIDRYNIKANRTYGTKRVNAYKIIEDSLNLKDTKVFDYVEDEDGKKVAILNKQETAIAQAKQEQIKNAFKEWIWQDSERRERLEQIYNEKFNSIRPREFDGSHLIFNGMNPEIKLRPHQLNAVARIIFGGNTLLAHEVGAGKTFTMVAAAMESKRLGLCNKSLFVVPNHIVEQFGQEFLQLYPGANILVSTKKDFETANRKKFCSRIATGEYDAVIIGHSQFEKIPMSIQSQIKLINEQVEDITNSIQYLKESNSEKFTVKQLEKTKKSLEAKLNKLNNSSRKDDVITFEQLGVDRIFVDEAHYYKNLFLYTKMRNVSGIPLTEAQKSSDLYMKCRYLDELTKGKGIIFATGTPISNSMVELYTMQRYLQYDELSQRGLQNFDAWASTFGETTTAIELAPEGNGYRAKTRFAKFFNLPELMAMFKEVADIQTSDMLKLPVPKANYHNIVIESSPIQKELIKSLSERADLVRGRLVKPTEDNMLKITNDGRKLALDQRLMNGMLQDYDKSKVAVCADNIYDIWKKTSNEKLAQLVFCDLSTPTNDGTFNVYDDLKKKLIERGIGEDDIEFIHNVNTDIKKQELFNKVRNGKVRILIGSTQKMGAGTNCQDKLIALHDLDCPWRPSDLIQRSGRIIRQGNTNSEVDIYRYVTKGTFDAYLYQLVENKQKFISQIMTSKVPVRSAEDIDEQALSYAEIKALAAGNPDIIKKTELDTQVAKLKILKQSYLSQKYELEDKITKFYPTEINVLKTKIENINKDLETFSKYDTKDKGFTEMIIEDKTYTVRKEAGEAIINCCKNLVGIDPVEIGKYKGFKMILSIQQLTGSIWLDLKNNYSYGVELGPDASGNITRIENVIDSINSKLSKAKEELENTQKQFENAKEDVKKPFSQEEELKEKTKMLDEINIKLNLGEKDTVIIDEEETPVTDSQVYKTEYER